MFKEANMNGLSKEEGRTQCERGDIIIIQCEWNATGNNEYIDRDCWRDRMGEKNHTLRSQSKNGEAAGIWLDARERGGHRNHQWKRIRHKLAVNERGVCK